MKYVVRPLLSVLAGMLLLAYAIPALAQAAVADTSVHIGWGDFIGQIGSDLVPVVSTLLIGTLLGLVVKAFPWLGAILTTQRTQQLEQLLERSLGYAAADMQDELKGKALTVDLKNDLVARASQYAWDHGSKAVLDFAGRNDVPDKLQARVLTSPAVTVATQGTALPPTASAVVK